MTKTEIFAIIKDANKLVDAMQGLSTNSEEYNNLNESLGWTLDNLMLGKQKWYTLHLSKKTGHYYVTF